MSNTNIDEKSKKQNEFWKAIINKCEDRNEDLEKEQLALQARVDQIEASMPAVMAFNMAKLAQNQPDANVSQLVTLPCSSNCKKQQLEPMMLPDMSNMSVFSINDPDVQYMKRIKDLSKDEKNLMDEVNKLRSKVIGFKEAAKKVDDFKNIPCSTTKLDGTALQNMNYMLLYENRKLYDELADLRLKLNHTRENILGPMNRELQSGQWKVSEYEAEVQQKINLQADKKRNIQNEITILKEQLLIAESNLRDMTDINSGLQDEVNVMKRRLEEFYYFLVDKKSLEVHKMAILKSTEDADDKKK